MLDMSAKALDEARSLAGESSTAIQWHIGDVRQWSCPEPVACWHDRATFHFFVDPSDQALYLGSLARSLGPGGVAILGVFGPEGPQSCSGLPIRRYAPDELARVVLDALGGDGKVISSRYELHVTPQGVKQQFSWVAVRRSP